MDDQSSTDESYSQKKFVSGYSLGRFICISMLVVGFLSVLYSLSALFTVENVLESYIYIGFTFIGILMAAFAEVGRATLDASDNIKKILKKIDNTNF